MSASTLQTMSSLLERMTNPDTDFRYMALADLTTELQKPGLTLDEGMSKKVVQGVLKALEDKNGEVQNLAVKCLAPLVTKCRPIQLMSILDTLTVGTVTDGRKSSSNGEVNDISSTALRTCIISIPTSSPAAATLTDRLLPHLIGALKAGHELETFLDVVIELISRFPEHIGSQSADLESTLITFLDSPRPAVRKRAVTALGAWSRTVSPQSFSLLISLIIEKLTTQGTHDITKTLITLLSELARSVPRRLGPYLRGLLASVYEALEVDDEEIRESGIVALEGFLVACPGEMREDVGTCIEIAGKWIKYDPNYAVEDEEEGGDDDMDDDDEGDDDDFDDDEGEYDDDEDVSWKIRRIAVKILGASIPIVGAERGWRDIAPILVARFGEREESVRVDVISAFTQLLMASTAVAGVGAGAGGTAVSSGKKRRRESTDLAVAMASTKTGNANVEALKGLLPKVIKALNKQLSSTSASVNTKLACFTALRGIVAILGAEVDEGLIAVGTSATRATLTSSGAGSAANVNGLRMEALRFVQALAAIGAGAGGVKTRMSELVDAVVGAVGDKFYKTSACAVQTCIDLIPCLSQAQGLDEVVKKLFGVFVERAASADVDAEVREVAVLGLGRCVASCAWGLGAEEGKRGSEVLLERLRNETTRLVACRAISEIAGSGVQVDAGWVRAVMGELGGLLRKANRGIRVAALTSLTALVRKVGVEAGAGELEGQLIRGGAELLSTEDMNVLAVALSYMTALVAAGSGSAAHVLVPKVLGLMKEGVVQGGGAVLDHLVEAAEVLAVHGAGDQLIDGIMADDISKGEIGIAARVLATVVVNGAQGRVEAFIGEVRAPKTKEDRRTLCLMTIGEVGKEVDLGGEVVEMLTGQFVNPSEEVRSAAAYAVGNVAVGNLGVYLPVLLKRMDEEKSERRLLLSALKEVIKGASAAESTVLKDSAGVIWKRVADEAEEDDDANRTVAAECAGRLTLVRPEIFLPELRARMKNESAAARASVISAVRYTFTETTSTSASTEDLLRPLIQDFLSLLEDADLSVRRLALFALNSAAHNRPALIREHLHRILPLLLEETRIRPELVREVQMGPFKHKVDDGLELRKSAFETMYVLLDPVFSDFNDTIDPTSRARFLEVLVRGLDDGHDIKVLSCLILTKLPTLPGDGVTAILLPALDSLAAKFRALLETKLKETAVKQDIEKNAELQRSVLRAVVGLKRVVGSGDVEGVVAPGWRAFVEEVWKGKFGEEVKGLEREREGQEGGREGDDRMDVS
ncbi:TIP120-domain-containing protein [Saitoella complicata NRRL Y-17804]|uniref:TIP120-domain-containing protein n=1 Tax=Saitoella complicata (strain BCRC 22490 / CBS 7301 / JCM 7358 / NBRC 10748 / NRRL Y-17804) TaxID=698492 RepID=UPI000866EB7A|nr:TIP120-domain-containing protein [Saitoella complicata NRRL Y-17804]ODQ55190.1 TIP120-domain-containing protein [Saitoella complicata NRRL Y-17804]